jgi:hypothetical protein
MSGKVQIVKKSPFDADLAAMEAENVEKVFLLHLKRCDDAESAGALSELFLSLGNLFAQKKIDLSKKI